MRRIRRDIGDVGRQEGSIASITRVETSVLFLSLSLPLPFTHDGGTSNSPLCPVVRPGFINQGTLINRETVANRIKMVTKPFVPRMETGRRRLCVGQPSDISVSTCARCDIARFRCRSVVTFDSKPKGEIDREWLVSNGLISNRTTVLRRNLRASVGEIVEIFASEKPRSGIDLIANRTVSR